MMRSFTTVLPVLALLLAPASAQFGDGYLYVADFNNNLIYEVDPATWSLRVFADSSDGLAKPGAVGFTASGQLLCANFHTNEILEFDATGHGILALEADDGLNGPFGENGLVVDSSGRIFVSNFLGLEILQFNADYTGGTVFADISDGVVFPQGLAFTASGDLLVANTGSYGEVLRFDPAGNGSVFDTIGGQNCYSAVVRDNGDVYVAVGSGNLYRYVGGDPNNRVLFGGPWGVQNNSLQFNLDHSVLYFANSNNGTLRVVDPDTGADTLVINGSWEPDGIAVFGNHNPPGSFTSIGRGLAGAGGITPTLTGAGQVRTGRTITVSVLDFVGGAPSYQLLACARQDRSLFGGTIYVDLLSPAFRILTMTLPGAAGSPGQGEVDLQYAIPLDPALVGTRWYVQQAALDPFAAQGISLSNGLMLYVGS